MSGKYINLLVVVFILGVLLFAHGAGIVASEVSETSETISFQISVSRNRDCMPGLNAEVSIFADSARGRLRGYDFFLSYDPKVLSFIASKPGNLPAAEGWGLFEDQTYSGKQIDGSDLNFIHLYAKKNTPGGEHHPNDSLPPSNQLATLQFHITTNRSYMCTFQPIRFYWRNCSDNILSVLNGDTVAFVDNVYDTVPNVPVADTIYLPGWHGPSGDCIAALNDVPVPMINFINGGFNLTCIDIIDNNRGDISVNGLAYETADGVMFTDYFVDGLSAFGSHVGASIEASDVYGDGTALTVADLVLLIRKTQDNAYPFSSVSDTASIIVYTNHRAGTMTLTTQSDSAVGAIYMAFDATSITGPPSLGPGADRMDLKYNVVNDSLRVLIFNIGNGDIDSGMQSVLTIPTDDAMPILYVEAATFGGIPMKAAVESVSQEFILGHNDPNPFSSATTIPLMLSVETDWSVCVLNVAADTVRMYSGHSPAGIVEVEWDGTRQDGTPAEGGRYLYRAVVGDSTATRTMTLVR